MVIRISLIASIVCLRVVEHVASKGWDYQAWRGSTGDDCKGLSGSRMQVGALDSISKIYEGAVAKALYRPCSWTALRPGGRTLGHASCALSIILSTYCSLQSMCFSLCRAMPFRLFLLLSTPTLALAKLFLSLSRCMLDEFSWRFLSFFDTPEKLLGGDARAFLLAAAMHLRSEICRIECRHALCRKWTRAWQTVSANVIDISTRFMIQRHRELDSFFD